MERIIVVGPSGSGKTTLAGRLSAALDLPHVELDGLWWDAGWTETGTERFGERLDATLGEHWVVDGNYVSQGTRQRVWPRADTVVFLDLPKLLTVRRVVVRTTARSLRGTELWNGNRESLRGLLGDDALIPFAWRNHHVYRERYEAAMADPELAHLTWVRLRTPREVDRWIRDLERRAERA